MLTPNPKMQSNGESALQYFAQRITQDALYLLDEPENSLSTHSPVLLSMKGARVCDLDSTPVTPRKWTDLANVCRSFDFFERHREEFL